MPWKWWRVLFAHALLVCGITANGISDSSEPFASPRYLLCQHTRLASARLAGGTVHVYAASVAGEEGLGGPRPGRQWEALTLRAALLLDVPGAWQTRLPRFKEYSADRGQAKDMSCAKCFGAELPLSLLVGCHVVADRRAFLRKPQSNRSALRSLKSNWGSLLRFRNEELELDVAHCTLGGSFARRWRWPPGPPWRLRIELLLRNYDESAILPLDLCRVDQPLRRLAFCTEPLYTFHKVHEELPWIIDDWLDYHLRYAGFEHGHIYDVDGSAAGPIKRWLAERRRHLSHGEGAAGADDPPITYWRSWPANISPQLLSISARHPMCAETMAYMHCLVTNRVLSRWVMLLHSPDEYVSVPSQPDKAGIMLQTLHAFEESLPQEPAAMLLVSAASYGRGGPGAFSDPMARGSMIQSSQQRSEWHPHNPVLDPASCHCAGPHTCYIPVNASAGGQALRVGHNDIAVHHYVEMLERNRGRCAIQHEEGCDAADDGALWIAKLLSSWSAAP